MARGGCAIAPRWPSQGDALCVLGSDGGLLLAVTGGRLNGAPRALTCSISFLKTGFRLVGDMDRTA